MQALLQRRPLVFTRVNLYEKLSFGGNPPSLRMSLQAHGIALCLDDIMREVALTNLDSVRSLFCSPLAPGRVDSEFARRYSTGHQR